MSLILAQSQNIIAKTGLPCECHGRGKVNLYRQEGAATKGNPAFDACISMHDFVCLMQYVLENTVLEGKDDPRAIFVKYAKTLSVRKVPKEGLRVVPGKVRKSSLRGKG